MAYDDLDHFDVIGEIDDGGGYEWSIGKLLKAKETNELYWVVESGCSCNDWFSNFGNAKPEDISQCKVANWQEAVARATKDALDNRWYEWSSDDIARFAERLMKAGL